MNTPTVQCIRLAFLTESGAQYVDNPSLARVLDVLASMDGEDSDTLSITLSNGDSMDVGGGANGMYKCHARTLSSFYDLLCPALQKDLSDTVDIQMDDEINSFPRCTVVSLDMVRIAVECFCVNGDLNASLLWDNTLDYEPL
jgi:hypothetical protein